MKLSEIKDAIYADTLTRTGGIYIARWGFLYTHGCTACRKAANVVAAFPADARIIDCGEVRKAFNGSAPLNKQSHWYVKFALDAARL